MENSIKPQKLLSQRIAEFLFTIYLITLYIFVDREETVIISKAVFVVFAAFTVIAVLRSRSIHIGKNVMSVYIAFTWMFATIFWAQDEYDATVMMKTMWQLFIQFFLIYNLFVKQKNAHEYLLKSLYIAGLVLIGYSLYIYGFSEIFEMMTSESGVRLGKEINQENSFGMMNATTVMVAFYYLLYKKRFKLFHMATIVSSFVLAMASGSRKALIIVCGGVIIMICKKYGWKKLYKVFVTMVVLVPLFMIIIELPMFETIKSRMESFGQIVTGEGAGDSSARVRMEMIADGWDTFKERLVIGFGANNYKSVTRFRTYSHNNFIEILVDFGLLGFALYYFVYINCFKNLWKAQSDDRKALFSIFLMRFMMEIAMVTYYDKLHWVLVAFYLIGMSDEKHSEKEITQEDNCCEQMIGNEEKIVS